MKKMKKLLSKSLALMLCLMMIFTMAALHAFAKGENIVITSTAVEQPAYNAKASYTLEATVTDDTGRNIEVPITWSFNGELPGDVSITEAGVLTITRTEDQANSEFVTVKATCEGIGSTTKKIIITPVTAYLREDRIEGSFDTGYSYDQFMSDMANAQHKAVLNFELGTSSIGKTYELSGNYAAQNPKYSFPKYKQWYKHGAKLPVSGTNSTINVNWENKKEKFDDHFVGLDVKLNAYRNSPAVEAKKIDTGITSGEYGVTLVKVPNEHNTIYFDNYDGTELKPIAIGYSLSMYGGGTLSHTPVVTFSDGTTKENTTYYANSSGDKSIFCGFKAPHGKYITSIDIPVNAWAKFDDLCIIMERFPTMSIINKGKTTELNYLEEISLADETVSGKTSVTATSPVKDGTTIITVYGENGNLIGFKATEGDCVSIDVDKNGVYTKVESFVWDMGNLQPLINKSLVEN